MCRLRVNESATTAFDGQHVRMCRVRIRPLRLPSMASMLCMCRAGPFSPEHLTVPGVLFLHARSRLRALQHGRLIATMGGKKARVIPSVEIRPTCFRHVMHKGGCNRAGDPSPTCPSQSAEAHLINLRALAVAKYLHFNPRPSFRMKMVPGVSSRSRLNHQRTSSNDRCENSR